MSVLLIHDVPITCINQAAIAYYVPAKVIIAVLNTEGGWVGLAKANRNGTRDYGPMQINSRWLQQLAAYGYTAAQLQYDPCVNVQVGTWILSREIASSHDYWQGVADYHSHTQHYNVTYQHQVGKRYAALNALLGE